MVSIQKPKFLKPVDDDFIASDREAQPTDDKVTTFVYNANHSLTLDIQRERLPIKKYRNNILYCLENYQILILVGETGCGKSTQVPQYLYEHGWHTKGLIGVTQPRQISAITLAGRVAEERGEIIGETVGVSVRLLEKCNANTKIKFMTEGILLREMLADPLLSGYGVLMIDEAHERNNLTDITLGLLKKVSKKRENLKIIISSATIDAEFFKKFFNSKPKNITKGGVAILSVEGRVYPVNILYLKAPTPDYIKETVNTVLKIHNKEPPGDILAFLTGQEEVLQCVNLLKTYKEDYELNSFQVLPFYGTLPNSDQLKVFWHSAKDVRKVVISTNIAETSVTIPGIVYVIDCGFVKLKCYNAESKIDSLIIVPISKAAAEQRSGRAGRIRRGKVYRLYTEEEFRNLPHQTSPEIRRTDLSSAILFLKALGVDNLLQFDFPSPPPSKNLLSALETLYALGTLDDQANLTMPVGYLLAEIPINPMMGKMLYVAGQMSCSEEILTIIAMLQVKSVFASPISAQARIKSRIQKRNFEASEGDLITSLNVYTAFVEHGRTKEFCGQHYLIYKNLKTAYELRCQLLSLVEKKMGIQMFSCNGNVETLCRCITAGFFQNAAYLHYSGKYKTIRGNIDISIHPLSTLYVLEQPQFVIFCELMQTTKFFMKDLTVIKQEWLTELAHHYYHKDTVKNIF